MPPRHGRAARPSRDLGSGRRASSRRERSRSRSQSRSGGEGGQYLLELLAGRHEDPLPMYDLLLEEEGRERMVPHVCSNPDAGYVIRVTVDGENALLRDGSLIVAPGDSRELPGFLVSKNFVGKEYVKEYRNFVFGKPKVLEKGPGSSGEEIPYTAYGTVKCAVFEAVLDEEVDSDQELRGQSTFFRGAGLHGSFDERTIEEGKKTHLLYSSVTVQGPRSSIANSTRGRWWVRGPRKLQDLEVRYREAHSLMLLGVDPRVLGLARTKEEQTAEVKQEDKDRGPKKEELELDRGASPGRGAEQAPGLVEVCDLTTEESAEGQAAWTLQQIGHAEPVDIDQPP